MQVPPVESSARPDERELVTALQLIARGSADDKLRYIASRDPDFFVDHVLGVDYADRDVTAPAATPTDRAVLDAVIARISLGGGVQRSMSLRASA